MEKEKERARLAGVIQAEPSAAEVAEDMQKERRLFQLHMCEVGAVPGRGRDGRGPFSLRRSQGAAPLRAAWGCQPVPVPTTKAAPRGCGAGPSVVPIPSCPCTVPAQGRPIPELRTLRDVNGTRGLPCSEAPGGCTRVLPTPLPPLHCKARMFGAKSELFG